MFMSSPVGPTYSLRRSSSLLLNDLSLKSKSTFWNRPSVVHNDNQSVTLVPLDSSYPVSSTLNMNNNYSNHPYVTLSPANNNNMSTLTNSVIPTYSNAYKNVPENNENGTTNPNDKGNNAFPSVNLTSTPLNHLNTDNAPLRSESPAISTYDIPVFPDDEQNADIINPPPTDPCLSYRNMVSVASRTRPKNNVINNHSNSQRQRPEISYPMPYYSPNEETGHLV